MAQDDGAFGEEDRDLPQTRDCTCAPLFETYGEMAENVTTPGGGAFHACAYSMTGCVGLCIELVPRDNKVIGQLRQVLDVRASLVKAGEMTNSVQMLMTNFDGCA
jgi:hypothetical protein